MGAILLDTTVVIDLLRGCSETIERLRTLNNMGDQGHICAITIEETVRGLRPREYDATRRLFSGLHLTPLGENEGWQAGEWRKNYAKRGRTLAQADCLIAAAALSIGGRLATGNPKDFPMQELTVEFWQPGI
jgi:predicted nucleic acid-binding protein